MKIRWSWLLPSTLQQVSFTDDTSVVHFTCGGERYDRPAPRGTARAVNLPATLRRFDGVTLTTPPSRHTPPTVQLCPRRDPNSWRCVLSG